MSTVAVITWKGRLPSDAEVGAEPAIRHSNDLGEQWAFQACQPVAVAVLEAVRNLGHKTNVDTPCFGEHSWHFSVEIDQRIYSIADRQAGPGRRAIGGYRSGLPAAGAGSGGAPSRA